MKAGFSPRRTGGDAATGVAGLACGCGRWQMVKDVRRCVAHSRGRRTFSSAECTPCSVSQLRTRCRLHRHRTER
eukprot:1543454-Pleurochrysis_carterae.AAC.1